VLDAAVMMGTLGGVATFCAALLLFVGTLRDRPGVSLFVAFGLALLFKMGALVAFLIEMLPASCGLCPSSPRDGTKLARVLELLQRDCGATLEELIAATEWLPHTTRAALTGLRKRCYTVTIDRTDKERGSMYRLRLGETVEAGQAAAQSGDPLAISTPKSKKARRGEKPQARQAA
jgi:hypothetical protein